MGCLLCGKEIGPLRQLRDSEFCSADHRSRYKERLGRALSSIAQPEPPPAEICDFRSVVTPSNGNCAQSAILTQLGPAPHAIQVRFRCPVSIDPVFGNNAKPLASPELQDRPSAGIPEPEPLRSSTLPKFAIALAREDAAGTTKTPAPPKIAAATASRKRKQAAPPQSDPRLCEKSFPLQAEAVEWWINTAHAVAWLEPDLPLLAPFALEAVSPFQPEQPQPSALAAAVALPPVPVESWMASSDAAKWITHETGVLAPLLEDLQAPAPPLAAPVPAPAASEVACFVQSTTSLELLASAHVSYPQFDLAISVDASFASAEEPVEVVDACEQWMPSPAAEPVARLVQWAEASALLPAIALEGPRFVGLSISDTYVPSSRVMAQPAAPIAVAMFVHTSDASQSIAPQVPLAHAALPGFQLALDTASYVQGAQPQPVESMPEEQEFAPAAQTIQPITAIQESTLPQASCTIGHSPARHAPVPVEDFVFPTFRGDLIATIGVAMPEFTITALHQAAAPGLKSGFHTRSMPAPLQKTAISKPAVLQPIRRLALVQPETHTGMQTVSVPDHGFIAVEFHCQKVAPSPSRVTEWQEPTLEVQGPRFELAPLFDNPEDLLQSKKHNKPAVVEFFDTRRKRKPRNPEAMAAIKAIAAGLVMGAILWFGMGSMRIASRMAAVNREVALMETASESTDSSASPSPARTTHVATPAEPHGPIARIRKAIASRAATSVTDSFRNGMEAWGTTAKAWAPGWSHHQEGYVQPGELAIFNPSVNYTDYHLEFFGQIDNKSMGWTVRSKDTKNYYAMKFAVLEPGLRPIIAMVHYPVVGGKKGKSLETPLNVMVHNNKPFQVAVDVKGNRMVTSIDGQEVDTWIDDTITQGGVGFFADAGEKARLYWMRVSKNEDFVGRMCAYLSSKLGDGSNASAEMWPPEIPGSGPLPGSGIPNRTDEASLAAAAMGLSGRGRRRKFGFVEQATRPVLPLSVSRRSDLWNS